MKGPGEIIVEHPKIQSPMLAYGAPHKEMAAMRPFIVFNLSFFHSQ